VTHCSCNMQLVALYECRLPLTGARVRRATTVTAARSSTPVTQRRASVSTRSASMFHRRRFDVTALPGRTAVSAKAPTRASIDHVGTVELASSSTKRTTASMRGQSVNQSVTLSSGIRIKVSWSAKDSKIAGTEKLLFLVFFSSLCRLFLPCVRLSHWNTMPAHPCQQPSTTRLPGGGVKGPNDKLCPRAHNCSVTALCVRPWKVSKGLALLRLFV